MDDLAAELGMSKKTLYANFPSKTALLEAVLMDKLSSAEADFERISSECSSENPSAFLAVLQRMLACIQGHMGEIQPPFLHDIRREAPQMFELVESRRSEMIQRYFGKILDGGRKTGIIRKDVPANLVIEILLGAVQAIINPRKLAELDITPQSGFTTILTVLLEGLITKEGRAAL
jgi:AcrR family transcriptional regulator